ncbi:acyl-CoA dehydrogenase family protein [Bradyrhizobium tropiciagri]|uniref:acyl-CoA dehydrogenase family protein n=1 Tax=Bradyrhizobium tropiciagri TaxID=312253 RepID=UPI001BAC5C96|nr:acyl-CoA dehydrogenase family protein [Bradyrhizobium tropiciagri]MBR0899149.1 acyl-CoA dehydrogenase family protein [Bradyrhizobium tropiciagri]
MTALSALATGEQRKTAINNARYCVSALRRSLDRVTGSLARLCQSTEGGLSAGLDVRQVAALELAWASADTLAAESMLASLDLARSDFETALGLVFVVDAVVTTLERLDAIGLDLDEQDQTGALRTDARFLALRRLATSASTLEAVGVGVAEADGELGGSLVSDDNLAVQDSVRRLAADVVAPLAERIHRHDLTVPEEVLAGLRDIGAFGLAIPEAFGGTAQQSADDTQRMLVVTEALSEASLGAAGSLITRPEILCRALLAGGTPEQKARWLPPIARGDILCAISITEPDYGSDVASLNLRATRVDGGWHLNGAKTWCTFAGKADLLMVVARTDPDRALGHRGLSLMLVEKPSDDGHAFDVRQPAGGRLIGRAIPTIGYRGMHSFDLGFEDFFVPDANVIGGQAGIGRGFYFTMSGMVGGRIQTSARACGVMRAALRAAIRYTSDRRVFGASLQSYALTRAKLARMGARFAACRTLSHAVARLIDQGKGRMEASLVKLLACRYAEIVTREALQLHGGMGYAEETPVSRYFVDARVLSIFEGAEETLALKVVARSLLEEALGLRAGAA